MFQNTKSIDTISEATLIQDLDAMPAALLNQTTDIRAEARLAQIMATDPNYTPANTRTVNTRTQTLAATHKRLTKKQLATRLAAIPAVAAGIIAGTVLAPTDSQIAPASAFATWTAMPLPLEGTRLDSAALACRSEIDWNQSLGSDNGPFQPATWQLQVAAQPTVAEQRGDWAFVQWDNSQRNEMANCLIIFVDNEPKVVTWASVLQRGGAGSGGQSVGLGEFGYFSPRGSNRANNRIETELTGNFLQWQMRNAPDGTATATYALDGILRDSGEFTVLSGRVGADVVSAVFHTTTGGDVTATIANGQFVAWWPHYTGIAAPDPMETSVRRNLTAESSSIAELAHSVTLALSDGTVLVNQPILTNRLNMAGTL